MCRLELLKGTDKHFFSALLPSEPLSMKHYLELSQILSFEIIFLVVLHDDDFFILNIFAIF